MHQQQAQRPALGHHPALQRGRPAPVALRRLRHAHLRPAGPRGPADDRVRLGPPEARLPVGLDLCRFIDEHLTDEAFDDPKVYNVGNPGNTTEIYDLAARIKAKTGSESDIVYADATKIYGPQYEEAESFEKLPELKNAAALGWQPRMDLDALIEETIAYYESHSDLRGASARL